MRKLNALSKIGMLTLLGGAMAAGVGALSNAPAAARPPGPECGPTRLWVCELPGCPDCYVVEFEGTVCEKNKYEKETGRKCTPEGV